MTVSPEFIERVMKGGEDPAKKRYALRRKAAPPAAPRNLLAPTSRTWSPVWSVTCRQPMSRHRFTAEGTMRSAERAQAPAARERRRQGTVGVP